MVSVTGRARPAGRVGYLFGSDRQHGRAYAGGGGVLNEGSNDVRLLRTDPDDFVRIHVPVNFGRLKSRPALDNIATVLNLITDADLNPRVLDWSDRLLKSYSGRVLNRPSAVRASTRDAIVRALQDVPGLVAPRVARFKGRIVPAMAAIERAEVPFPAILRVAGTHNGDIVRLMPDAAAMIPLLKPDVTYLLTEFVDVADGSGLYHKIRIFYFGDVPVVRHRLVSDRWMVHGADRERVLAHHPAEIERERMLLANGIGSLPKRVQQTLATIRGRIPLDYFGIDFALLPDGRIVLFEANATMNFFPLSTHPAFAYAGAPVVAAATAALDRLIESGWTRPRADAPHEAA